MESAVRQAGACHADRGGFGGGGGGFGGGGGRARGPARQAELGTAGAQGRAHVDVHHVLMINVTSSLHAHMRKQSLQTATAPIRPPGLMKVRPHGARSSHIAEASHAP